MTIMEQIYYKLALLNVSSVINDDVNYVKSNVDGCDDLHLDVMDRSPVSVTISLGHYNEKGGELCADPDMQIRIYADKKKAQAMTFFQTTPHVCRKVYNDENEIDPQLNVKLNAYLNTWLSELINKGHSFKGNNMTVKNRVEQGGACEIINLTETEKVVYSGAGWKLARFVNGLLVEMFDPLNQMAAMDDINAEAGAALDAAVNWAKQADGEVWQVMCSCGQLCEPEPFSTIDALAVAKLGRRIGETLAVS